MDGTFALPLWAQQVIIDVEGRLQSFIPNTIKTEDLASLDGYPTSVPISVAPNHKVVGSSVNITTSQHSELPSIGSACAKGRFGSKQNDKSLYAWTDHAGTRHISDKRPIFDNTSPVSILGTYPAAQFITRFIGEPMSVDFQDKLSQRLARLIKKYAQVLDVTTVREVRLNFRFFKQQTQFDRYKKRVAPTTPSRTGFYRHASNEMVILVTDEEAGLHTSIHEAVHGINRALFGSMARWLNEGLAQVLAVNTSNINTKAPRLTFSMSKDTLFNATHDDWDGPLRNQLYQSSKTLIHQLMASKRGRNSIARLLLAEQVNGCDNLTNTDVSRILGRKKN